ncbi:MAG: hypothetical protein ACK4NM_19380, partial [Hydrogenophaga sp.]
LAAASRAGHDGMSRKINQDAYVVSPHFQDNTEQLLVGVFDGHGAQGAWRRGCKLDAPLRSRAVPNVQVTMHHA